MILNDIAKVAKTQGGKHDVIDPRLLFKIGQVGSFAHGAVKKKNVNIVTEPGRSYSTADTQLLKLIDCMVLKGDLKVLRYAP